MTTMTPRDAIADWIKIGSKIKNREVHCKRADHILAALYAAGYKVEPREPNPLCEVCHGSGIEEVSGGHGTVLELPCSLCLRDMP